MDKDSFNLEVYKSLRDEITLRVSLHYKMVLAKYALGGALFTYLITHQAQLAFNLSPFLIVSGFAFLLDVAILENLGLVRSIGSFIKNHIETADPGLAKWETLGAQPSGRWVCFSVPGYILGTWSSGLAFFIAAFVIDLKTIDRANLFAVIVCAYLLAYTFYLIIRHLGGGRVAAGRSGSPIP